MSLSLSDTHAACGWWWFTKDCWVSPYTFDDEDRKPQKIGYDAVVAATDGQVTKQGITLYAQVIVKYLMSFISVIAVIYIIYAGFQLMIGGGDEEKMKKARQIITYIILGIVLMWLAYPIVKWTLGIINPTVAYEWSIIPSAQAETYTESDADTFAEYKNKVKEGINQMEIELLLNKSVSASTVKNVQNLIQWAYDRLPDTGDVGASNKEAKQVVDTYLYLAIANPSDSNHIGNAISRASSFIDGVSISRITGDISAGPVEWNSPLSVSFRAEGVIDPSGTTPPDSNYIWWTRENGGYRRELSRGPSLSYTFTKEGTYTIFLDVVSGSRNSKWKTDVLPLSVSKQISVKPKLGEIILLINGVNVSNMNTLKISPAIGKMGVILDASASRAIGNGTIAETTWEFGNGNESVNRGGPIVERQLYTNESGYILKLSMKTNDGQIISKEMQLIVRDPSAIITLDQETGNIGEDISMSATSYLADTRNVEYSWQIQDENNKKVLKVGDGMNLKYKFNEVGSYIVTLTAKSPNGTTDTDSKVITIESRAPVVSIESPTAVNPQKPNTIVFDASKSYDPDTSSRKNLSYVWRIDGERVTLDNRENDWAKWTYTFENKWSHTVSVTVANAYGKITTAESEFNVTSTLAVNMITTPKVVSRNAVINMIGQSPNAEFFEWNMWDGSAIISDTNRSIQYAYKQSGTYNATLTVSTTWDAETNSITRKIYVSNTESPFAIIDATNSSNTIIEEVWACNWLDAFVVNRAETTNLGSSNSVNIDGTTSGLTYTWRYFGKVSTNPQISEKFNELGCFPIELTVRSDKNGSTHTATKYIKLTNQLPELTNITSSTDAAKKDSQKVLVTVQANGAIDPDGVITSYIWYYTTESDPEPQNVQISQKNSITFVLPNITEKYYFGVILEDNDGARMNSMKSGQSPTPLVIDNSNGNIYLPLITLTAPKSSVNVGEKLSFSVEAKTIVGNNITNKSEYAWDWDGDGRIDEKSSSPNVTHTYTRSGDYNMKVRVTNNGVSNTKYQNIKVKNKLKADVYGYKLPDGRISLINASEWSYDKARWEIGSIVSESLSSVMIAASNTGTTGKLTVSSSDTDVSTIDIDLTKIETISGTWVLFQSYPKAIDDTITVKNPGDAILISMYWNSGVDNYGIDTNTVIDTSLDGVPENDTDNRDDGSYTDGSVFTLHDLASSNKRENRIKISLIKDGAVISSRNVTVILDYISSMDPAEWEMSGSGIVGLSQGDRAKLEELSRLIRELTEGDRIILMQRYNTLVENWNNTFDKAKSLIDIQEGIESGTMDSEQKAKLTKAVDDLLIGDSQVTDEIGIAVHLIRDLIPAESPNQAVLLTKLAEIESHPTLLDTNKKLWTEMLVLIETDTTIPDKYKVHIKNQLSIIVNGGSASIPTSTGTWETVDSSASSGILGFISGFVKIFFIIIGIILLIGVIGFILYRVSRKDDNIGFQDFLIDAVFHSKRDTVSPVEPTVKPNIVTPTPIPKEDPLSSYTPPAPIPKIDPIAQMSSTMDDPLSRREDILTAAPEMTPAPENIPEWLKIPTPVPAPTPTVTDAPVVAPIEETRAEVIPPIEDIDTSLPKLETTPTVDDTSSDDGIPDWIKNSPINQSNTTESDPLASPVSAPITPVDTEKLPDWLMSSIQEEPTTPTEDPLPVTAMKDEVNTTAEPTPSTKKKTVKKTVKKSSKSPEKAQESTPEQTPIDDTSNIPSWLK